MKRILLPLVVIAFYSCGNGSSDSSTDTATMETDTSFTGSIYTDTTGVGGMNADTTGMGEAR